MNRELYHLLFEEPVVNAAWSISLGQAVENEPNWIARCAKLVRDEYKRSPEARDGYARMGYWLLGGKTPRRASGYFERDIQLGRISWWQRLQYAACLMSLGEERTALRQVAGVYRTYPEARNGYATLGMVMDGKGMSVRAAVLAQKDATLNRLTPGFMLNVAVLQMKAGKTRRAIGQVRRAYALDGRLERGFCRLIPYAFRRGDWKLCCEMMEADQERGNVDESKYYHYAVSLGKLGYIDRAISVAEKMHPEKAQPVYKMLALICGGKKIPKIVNQLLCRAGIEPVPALSKQFVAEVDWVERYWPASLRPVRGAPVEAPVQLICVNGNTPQTPQLDAFLETLRDPKRGDYQGRVCIVSTGISFAAKSYLSRYDVSFHEDRLNWLYHYNAWYVIAAFVRAYWDRKVIAQPKALSNEFVVAFSDYRNKHFSKLGLLSMPESLLDGVTHILFFDGDIMFQRPLREVLSVLEPGKFAVSLEKTGIIEGSHIYESNRLAETTPIGKFLRNGPNEHEVNVGFLAGEKENMLNLFCAWKRLMFEMDLEWLFTAHPHYAWHEQDFMRLLMCLRPRFFQRLLPDLVLHLCNGGDELAQADDRGVFRLYESGVEPAIVHFAGGLWKDYLPWFRKYSRTPEEFGA